jgi:hypothetical protein
MSPEPDFERAIRAARDTLPVPDAPATSRARSAALRKLGRRRIGIRAAAAVTGALAIAVGLGIGLGALLTPSSTAAQGPIGLGFLPADGWTVVQSGSASPRDTLVFAVAANVAIDPEDVVAGAPEPSGLPYATLQELRSSGIVIVATFTRFPVDTPVVSGAPVRRLPLRMRDAIPNSVFGRAVRPEQPLVEYQLRATVNGYDVNLDIYFGSETPTETMLADAQRQIDRLVVRAAEPASATAPNEPSRPLTPARAVIDRTYVCGTAVLGGARTIEAKGHKGTGRSGSIWRRPSFVAVTTGSGTFGGLNASGLDNSLAWVTAGQPSATSTFIEGSVLSDLYQVRRFGTLAVNAARCRATKAPVRLTQSGLLGGVLGPFEEGYECVVPKRVLLRVHGLLRSAPKLTGYRTFLRTTARVAKGEIAVRSESGRLLAYGDVLESGRARLFVAEGCRPK